MGEGLPASSSLDPPEQVRRGWDEVLGMLSSRSQVLLMSISYGWVLKGKRAGSGYLPSIPPYGLWGFSLLIALSAVLTPSPLPLPPADDSLPQNPFHKEILELRVGKGTGELSICEMGIRCPL